MKFFALMLLMLTLSETAQAELLQDLSIDFQPALKLTESYNSNLLNAESNELESWITTISPEIKAQLLKEKNSLHLLYRADAGFYASSKDDDYLDHALEGGAKFHLLSRNEIAGFARYSKLHDNRGTVFSRGKGEDLKQLDKYRLYQLNGEIVHGSENSTGRIVLNLRAIAKRYDERYDTTRIGNTDTYGGTATFFYRTLPNTSLLFEMSLNDINFVSEASNTNSLKNRESIFYVGSTWDISELTQGSLKIGARQKSFADSGRNSDTNFSWDIKVKWLPLRYSQFEFITASRTEETNGIGDYIDTKSAGANWIHYWSERFSNVISLNVAKSDYRPTNNAEGVIGASLQTNYQFLSWVELTFQLAHERRLSNQQSLDYQKNVIVFGLLLTESKR